MCRYTQWMKRLQEAVLPLMLYVERVLPQVSGLRLDAALDPPLLTDDARNAHDPMLQQVPLHRLEAASDLPAPLEHAVLRARDLGEHSISGSEVMCAVCIAAVQDAHDSDTLTLEKVLPTSPQMDPVLLV